MKFSPDVAAAVVAASTRCGVEAAFLAAIVQQESGGNRWAVKYEPNFNYLWDVETNAPYRGTLRPDTFPAPDFVTSQTEWMSQKTSWGICQVMGAVARDLGFAGKFLSELCDPSVGAEYGARFVQRLQKKYTDLALVASAYNAGHPTPNNLDTYTTPVLKYYAGFQLTGF